MRPRSDSVSSSGSWLYQASQDRLPGFTLGWFTWQPLRLLWWQIRAGPTSAPPTENTPTTALESPVPDKTSAAPAPVSEVQLLQPLLRRIYLYACYFQPFLVIFFILQNNAKNYFNVRPCEEYKNVYSP
jgi:hypothetical protein